MNIEFLPLQQAVHEFSVGFGLLFAVLYFFVEYLDSSLTFSLTQHKSVKSAIMTFVLYLVLAIEIGAIVTNYLYVLPIALGAAAGSYMVVEHEKKKRPL